MFVLILRKCILFSCTFRNLVKFVGPTLFIARGGNELVFTTLRNVLRSSNVVSDVQRRRTLSPARHRFLSVLLASALFDLMVRYPMYPTEVSGGFHQTPFRRVVIRLVFLLFRCLWGDVNFYVKQWNRMAKIQMYSRLRSNFQARQVVGRWVLSTENMS